MLASRPNARPGITAVVTPSRCETLRPAGPRRMETRTMSGDQCLFCRIVAGEIPVTKVHETADTVAFRDINPQAPVHVLVIPRAHHADVSALGTADPALAGRFLRDVAAVAEAEGVAAGYRLVFNTGADAGQTVFHVHGHVLGKRALTWPPG